MFDTCYGIAFDLDGVLVDPERRYMEDFVDVLEYFDIDIDYERVKVLFHLRKRKRLSILHLFQKYIPRKSEVVPKCYGRWLNSVENWKYLQYDVLKRGVYRKLEELHKEASLALITSRTERLLLIKELNSLNIRKYFIFILTRQNIDSKMPLLQIFKKRTALKEYFFVTDTEKDIEEGKRLGFKTIAIVSGIGNRKRMEKMHPHLILKDISVLSINILKSLCS